MSTEQYLPFSVVSVVEDVIQQQQQQQQGVRLSEVKFASRKAEETCMYLSLFYFFD